MSEPNKHVRAAQAHLSHAEKPSFIDDTIKGLLDEIERLRAEDDANAAYVDSLISALRRVDGIVQRALGYPKHTSLNRVDGESHD